MTTRGKYFVQYGTDQNDWVRLKNKFFLLAGSGDDTVMSGSGPGKLYGEQGSDIFVISPSSETISVEDFSREERDKIDVSLFGISTFEELRTLGTTHERAGETFAVFELSQKTRVIVKGWSLEELTAEDFIITFAPGELPLYHALPFVLPGTTGADCLRPIGDRTILDGSKGDDTLFSGRKSAIASGGAGADTFVVERGSKFFYIDDFNREEGDKIDLSAFAVTSLATLKAGARIWTEHLRPNGTEIELSEGTILVIGGWDIDALQESDFNGFVPVVGQCAQPSQIDINAI
jgi:Ca2+-binding RTX toxin-like protein